MEHSVPLHALPPGLQFTPEQAERIFHDPQRRCLVYRGVMRKADYDALIRLSDDLAYLDAVQQLFSRATYKSQRQRGRGRYWVMAGSAAILMTALAGSLWLMLR